MILSLAILPESLSKEMRDQAIKKAAAEREEAAAREAAERAWEEGEGGHNGPLRAARRVMRTWTRRAFTPFEPLRILAPQARDDDEPRRGRDWNLFILAGASFAVTLTHVSDHGKDTENLLIRVAGERGAWNAVHTVHVWMGPNRAWAVAVILDCLSVCHPDGDLSS